MEIDTFTRECQRKRTARKRRTQYQSYFSSSSSGIYGCSKGFPGTETHDQDNGGCNIERHHQCLTLIEVYGKTKYVLVDEDSKLLNTTGSHFSCFPRGPRSKAKAACKQIEMNNHIAGVSAEEIFNEYPCPTSSTARPRACRNGPKRKTKPKDEQSDFEVIVPRRVHFRGRVRRGQNNSNTITNERGKLDSATFLHYFMHIWSAFPEEKTKSVTYFDPLWFDLYANEKNRVMVLNWIKETGVFLKKYVLVPIVTWSHWSLLIFCNLGENLYSKINTPCMLLLDSLHSIGPTRLEPLIRRLLCDIHKSEERQEAKEQLKKVRLMIPKVPQQKKGDECGFYVLYFIKLFLESTPENFDISEGYPYFMKKDWFTVEEVDSFCKSLDAFPLVLGDHDDSASSDSSDCVEFIKTSFFDERA